MFEHFYQCFELLNKPISADKNKFVQYIFDVGAQMPYNSVPETRLHVGAKAVVRLRGVMGDDGLFTPMSEQFVKIGQGGTQTTHSHRLDKMLFWIRELWVDYHFRGSEGNFFKLGFFPYHIAHGLYAAFHQ